MSMQRIQKGSRRQEKASRDVKNREAKRNEVEYGFSILRPFLELHKKRALFTCEQCSFLGVELLNHLFSSMYSVVYYEGKKYAYSTPHICSQVLTYSTTRYHGFNVGCVNVSLPFRKRFDRAYVRAGPQRGKTGQGPGQGMSAFHRMSRSGPSSLCCSSPNSQLFQKADLRQQLSASLEE